MSVRAPRAIPGFAGELVRPGDHGDDRLRVVWNAHNVFHLDRT